MINTQDYLLCENDDYIIKCLVEHIKTAIYNVITMTPMLECIVNDELIIKHGQITIMTQYN